MNIESKYKSYKDFRLNAGMLFNRPAVIFTDYPQNFKTVLTVVGEPKNTDNGTEVEFALEIFATNYDLSKEESCVYLEFIIIAMPKTEAEFFSIIKKNILSGLNINNAKEKPDVIFTVTCDDCEDIYGTSITLLIITDDVTKAKKVFMESEYPAMIRAVIKNRETYKFLGGYEE